MSRFWFLHLRKFSFKLKWGASSRWSFGSNSAWSSIETTTIGKTHPTLVAVTKGYPTLVAVGDLRVVQTRAILFLKSMSERGGSDIERRHLKSIWSRSRIPSFNFSVVVCRIRLFPTLISKIKWLGSGLPLNPAV